MNPHLHCVTAESVRRGHPDKLCDQIADSILDAFLKEDPNSRVAIEVMATDGEMMVAGEIASNANVSIPPIIKSVIDNIGYQPNDLGPEGHIDVHVNINDQSPDIAQAVTRDGKDIGAGDQGIVVGYATDETPEMLPLPVVLAHRICNHLDIMFGAVRMEEKGEPMGAEDYKGLGADGKAQVTVLYNGSEPVAISTVVVSFQHDKDADLKKLKDTVRDHLTHVLLPQKLLRPSTRILINPSGRFVKGGPSADTGLTGRKLAVDLYGPVAHIGGGALSGKDATKTDRSGAYAARWVAKCIVASGLAQKCEVQIAYAIGRNKPVSMDIDTFGTGILPDYVIEKAVSEVFDLRPAAIIDALKLRNPIYSKTSVYGHFGDNTLPWENTEKRRELIATAIRQNTIINAAVDEAEKRVAQADATVGACSCQNH